MGSEMEVNEEDLSTVDDEYCVQFFGFHPQQLMNGIYNAICEYLQEAIAALNETILKQFEKVSESELKEMSRKQCQVAVDRLDAKFDKAEVYLLNNIFHIPAHVLLPSDEQQVKTPCTEDEMKKLDEEIQDVTDKITAVKYANVRLEERLAEIRTLQDHFDPCLEKLDQMLSTVSKETVGLVEKSRYLHHLSSLVDKCHLQQ